MIKNRKLAIIYLLILIIFFLLNLFVINITSKIELLPIFILLLICSKFFFKFRRFNGKNKNIIILVMLLIGILQIGIYYIIGMFNGFSNNAIMMSINRFLNVIFPMILILTIIEYLRYQMIYKEEGKLSLILCTILFILIDINLFGTFVNFNDLNSTLNFFGIVLFPSIINNIVFNKITIKYGYKPIIIYRIITIISLYVLPIIPNMNMLLRSICRIIIPLIIFLLISYMFDRVTFENIVRKKRNINISTLILIIIIIIMSGLISCSFKYGLIAVGSGSMSGAINIGDAVLFEKYNKQKLEIGDIIIYNKDNKNIIHRIVEIGIFNDDYVYVTKGDKNKYVDSGYVYRKDIVGVVNKRIKYLGLPSIWVRSLFND